MVHVSQLRKYLVDSSHEIDQTELQLEPDLTLIDQPVRIVDRKDKTLRNQKVLLVRIVWSRGDSTWEREDKMRELYPHLFETE